GARLPRAFAPRLANTKTKRNGTRTCGIAPRRPSLDLGSAPRKPPTSLIDAMAEHQSVDPQKYVDRAAAEDDGQGNAPAPVAGRHCGSGSAGLRVRRPEHSQSSGRT